MQSTSSEFPVLPGQERPAPHAAAPRPAGAGLALRAQWPVLAVYTLTMFASAALLFLVQPLFTKMILPLLGGSPAVWNTAVVVYQALLLGGYLYAHLTVRWLGVRRQALLHAVLLFLPLLVLPIAVPGGWTPPAESNPVPWLVALLLVAIGLPFFVISTTSPLLQAWFARSGHPAAADPYFLYAASNFGSMLSLLAYPILVESNIRLGDQSTLWTIGYGLMLVLTLACAVIVWRSPAIAGRVATAEVEAAAPITLRRRLRWILLAFVPSALMLSVTTYASTQIAPIPLIWVIPLGLYLLTFILVFAKRRPLSQRLMERTLPFVLLPLVLLLSAPLPGVTWITLIPHLLAFFVACMVCHGALADDRPAAGQLTEFFVWLSVGGVLGGVFTALLAPLLFTDLLEYPLAIVLLCLLLPRRGRVNSARKRRMDLIMPAALGVALIGFALLIQRDGRAMTGIELLAGFGLATIVCFGFARRPLRLALGVGAMFFVGTYFFDYGNNKVLFAERTFFGVHRVAVDSTGGYHRLINGSVLHGQQSLDPARRREPLTYYSRGGPLGQVFAQRPSSAPRRVAVIGLGAGTVACYSRPGDAFTFYEIDAAVARIAREPRYFTFLQECTPDAPIVLGDGRLKIAGAPAGAYDMIILDAFTSDAPPVHLLTREALALYLEKLAPGGVLVYNISNVYLDLSPVIANLGADAGLTGFAQTHLDLSADEFDAGVQASRWAVLARTPADLGGVATDPRWQALASEAGGRVWTDDYSSILSTLRGR